MPNFANKELVADYRAAQENSMVDDWRDSAIADYLSAGSTVVLNIESLDRMSAIRLIDFLLGAIHVLGGDMKSVTKTTLVFAPRNVGVQDLEDTAEEEVEEVEEVEEIYDEE